LQLDSNIINKEINSAKKIVMNPANKDNEIKHSSNVMIEESSGSIQKKIPDKFDLSILGNIDLIEAEKIASEEVIFLTEEDLIEGLEDFELIPIKNYKDDSNLIKIDKKEKSQFVLENEPILKEDKYFNNDRKTSDNLDQIQQLEKKDELVNFSVDSFENSEQINEDLLLSDKLIKLNNENIDLKLEIPDVEDGGVLVNKIANLETSAFEVISEFNEELPSARKLFTVKINEETLNVQLSSILNVENFYKTDDKIFEKYNDLKSFINFRFIDDQFLNKPAFDDEISYNEDPLTERLVKMIDVSDGKLELLEAIIKDDEGSNYILEDYTLYNSEKFDTAFKEDVFYVDSDFEFIDNAIIRDDFTKYIHEIDDYFESEESLAQSEISEILGLIPDENDYIEDKLFGDYYKRYDLDNEIDFIKPEIDFFRSNYTGLKNLNYFTENEDSLLNSEKISIEEDISSANAIVFEEDISEIQSILKRDYGRDLNEIIDFKLKKDEIVLSEEITDITDRILILEDKEKMKEFATEFHEKNENLIRLLSYLDGLFEKLPEEVIRKFAESEYFELYSKVLKEMGV